MMLYSIISILEGSVAASKLFYVYCISIDHLNSELFTNSKNWNLPKNIYQHLRDIIPKNDNALDFVFYCIYCMRILISVTM